jgi:2-keto-4-pentenoate hydratase/2-oxohepta-3-ene-1,7-dioic acid hydratase in catechol pathway
MKLATYQVDGIQKIGAVTEDRKQLVDLAAAAEGRDEGRFASMLALIDGGDAAVELARGVADTAERAGTHLHALDDVILLAPIPVPPQIRDFSVFPAHIRQAPVGMRKLAAKLQGAPIPDVAPADEPAEIYQRQPIYYFTNRFSVVGPEAEVKWPRYSNVIDFEFELAAVLGRGGKDIAAKDAGDHIFGYTILNDFSARDTQLAEMQGMLGPAKGKSFDMGNAMGPWIVTRDEIPDVKALTGRVRINGETFVEADFSDALHSFEEMIAFVSRDETLYSGEVLGSGTVGHGCGLERFEFFSGGDVFELEIDAIGVLRNKVAQKTT